jgi:hypothetical protein
MKLKDLPFKYQKYLLVIALILSAVAISIRGSGGEVKFIFDLKSGYRLPFVLYKVKVLNLS